MQFNAFLQGKLATQTIGGGNTEEFYAKEGTLKKSQMLVAMHPDVARIVERYGRWHHQVDYSNFKYNKLILREKTLKRKKDNPYPMTLVVS